jgi:pseudaminic acid synthase
MAKVFKFPFFVAEISANHNGSYLRAKKLIKLAKDSGADAVKLQTFKPETMTINSDNKYFKIKEGLWKGNNLWDLYKKAQTPYEWHKDLFNYAKTIGIKCFSTPFDETAVDFLESLECPIYKIASFEMQDLPLIKKVAMTKKPIIISTGMANLKEIEIAYNFAKKNGARNIALLYCVSNYPSKNSDFNLNNIKILKKKFNCTIGFSDHSQNDLVAFSAVSAGAQIVEKHIALGGQKKGLDIKFSLKGREIKKFSTKINLAKNLIGKDYFSRSKSENRSKKFRRSIFVIKNIKKGEQFTTNNIKSIRPGYGLSPINFDKILKKRSPQNINEGIPLTRKIFKKVKIKFF